MKKTVKEIRDPMDNITTELFINRDIYLFIVYLKIWRQVEYSAQNIKI